MKIGQLVKSERGQHICAHVHTELWLSHKPTSLPYKGKEH